MMKMYTLRLRKGPVLAVICCLLAAVAGMVLGYSYQNPEVIAVFGRNKAEVKCEDNQARVDYLKAAGWEVESEPVETEVVIPTEFDNVYKQYAQIQEKQGFRLEKYRGETAVRYSYTVKNFPDGEKVVANLLLFKGRIIAADLSSAELGGFIRGLDNQPLELEKTE